MIILLQGVDTFRSQRFLQQLKKKFITELDPDSESLSILNGEKISLKDLGEKINTGSLFVKKRLIVIENIFKNKSEKVFAPLTDYLKKFIGDEDNIIIFREEESLSQKKGLKTSAKKLLNFLIKQPYSQEFKALTVSQLLNFIKQEAKSYQKEIDRASAMLLMNLTSNDLWLISKALRKLAFHSKQKIISTAEIKKMVKGSFDENIFALTDALSAKNKELAMALLEEQYIAGLSQEYLIAMLIRQFKILLQIRIALDKNMHPAEIASYLQLHPFVVKKGLIQAKNFTSSELKTYFNRISQIDFLNKTGRGNIKAQLILLISEL